MKKETQRFVPEPVNLTGKRAINRHENSYYKNLINEQLTFIEIQCRKAVKQKYNLLAPFDNDITIENEALELNNIVLDKLRDKDYKVLKQFKGNARITTYITAIISNQAVDLIRKKKGRAREKERARKFGDLGEKIYDMILVEGLSPSHAYDELKSEFNFNGSLEDLQSIVEKIRGRGRLERGAASASGSRVVKEGERNIETGELIIADTRKTPEDSVIEAQRDEKIKEVLTGIISQLKGEERLMLRMRFPFSENEEAKDIDQIARLLGVSKKAVYNRISRVLKKCREMIINSGVNFDDLF